MSTTSSPANVQELVAAYRTLDLELRASPLAIRTRYRELVQVHHPDKWPQGSAEQAAGAERMREINAAYDLIEDAPLQFQQTPTESPSEPVYETPRRYSRSRWDWLFLSDPPDLFTCMKFLYGASAGGALAYWLGGGLMQNQWYFWLVPLAMGFVFARTSWLSNWLLEAIISWVRRV